MEHNDLTAAREMLAAGGYTCVLRRGDTVYTATERGVKPLVRWLAEGLDTRDFSAADRVVGRATAYLYRLLGVTEVWRTVGSATAATLWWTTLSTVRAPASAPLKPRCCTSAIRKQRSPPSGKRWPN